MFENSTAYRSKEAELDLIKELVELRQFKAEHQRIGHNNQLLIGKLSDMEVTITELTVELKAKTIEIASLKKKLEKQRSSENWGTQRNEPVLHVHTPKPGDLQREFAALQSILPHSAKKRDRHLAQEMMVHQFRYSPRLPFYQAPKSRLRTKVPVGDSFADHFPEDKEVLKTEDNTISN